MTTLHYSRVIIIFAHWRPLAGRYGPIWTNKLAKKYVISIFRHFDELFIYFDYLISLGKFLSFVETNSVDHLKTEKKPTPPLTYL